MKFLFRSVLHLWGILWCLSYQFHTKMLVLNNSEHFLICDILFVRLCLFFCHLDDTITRQTAVEKHDKQAQDLAIKMIP